MLQRHFNFVPARRLLALLLACALFSLLLFLLERFTALVVPGANGIFSLSLTGILLCLALADWWLSGHRGSLDINRALPGSVAVNRWLDVPLTVRHNFGREVSVSIHEQLPPGAVTPHMPLKVVLRPGVVSRTRYRLKALQRGDLDFTGFRVRVPSLLQLWSFDLVVQAPAHARVYPDFSAITAYSLLATDNHVSQIGIRKRQRRGEGTEFHQLREYRQGDSLRQVDWKATSRRRKLVSRDYADERDQEIVLMVDTGRRMRAKDDDLSHFDHSLNALLLVSYIALRQGDSVSAMSFGSEARWIPPQKGAGRVNTILNSVYDLQPGNAAADYVAAARRLVAVQPKRALVMIASNCRDEDIDELLVAVQLLRKRHLVLLANLRESALDQRLRDRVDTFEDALTYAGVNHYLASRAKVQQHLESRGVLVLDCAPQNLAAQMANAYLEIKRAGVL